VDDLARLADHKWKQRAHGGTGTPHCYNKSSDLSFVHYVEVPLQTSVSLATVRSTETIKKFITENHTNPTPWCYAPTRWNHTLSENHLSKCLQGPHYSSSSLLSHKMRRTAVMHSTKYTYALLEYQGVLNLTDSLSLLRLTTYSVVHDKIHPNFNYLFIVISSHFLSYFAPLTPHPSLWLQLCTNTTKIHKTDTRDWKIFNASVNASNNSLFLSGDWRIQNTVNIDNDSRPLMPHS
jgi:hypothetical protein